MKFPVIVVEPEEYEKWMAYKIVVKTKPDT